jgi:8-oxo-dGTP pyrophosphatase MutT (NUDIX family)
VTEDPFKTLAQHTAYQNPWIRLEHRDVMRPDGPPGVYGIVRFANLAVGVLPVLPDGRVPLVGQWRVPHHAYSWEIPEGGVPHGEDPLAGARRELAEETGLTATTWTKLVEFDVSNSVTDEKGVVYLATGLTEGVASPDGTEVLSRQDVPFRELLAWVDEGQVRDSLTIIAVLKVHQLALTGRLPEALTRAMLDT